MSKKPTIRSFLRRLFWWTSRALLVGALLVAIAAGSGWFWLERNVLSSLPEDLSEYREFRPLTNVNVFAADGTQIDSFYVERRVWVPLEELPQHVWQAFVAAEDRRFLQHHGVDFEGIVRAFYVNWQAGDTVQGGSTLTQQLVKNLIVGKEKSYERKIKEAVLAWRLENELTKHEILELYLNYVALGNGNYGVEAASMDYFGISARQIDAGQAALLAGLVPAPSRYSPRNDPSRARNRRAIILDMMVSEGYLDADTARSHIGDPVMAIRPPRVEARPALAYVTEVRREVRRLFGNELPFKMGFQVHTPLDLETQEVAERAVRNALRAHQSRHGALGAVRTVPEEQREAFLERGFGLHRDPNTKQFVPPEPGQCFHARVPKSRDLGALEAGDFTFSLDREDRNKRVVSEGRAGRHSVAAARAGDVLRVCLVDEERVRLEDRPWSEGAAVVLENATGNVIALVAGWDNGLEGFVRATQAQRQPGSSFKPYVYAAALANGRTQLDVVVDGPISFPGGNGRVWSPRNYSGGYYGPVQLRYALTRSLNTVAVRLMAEVGPDEATRLAQRMGIRTPLRSDLTVALGSSEVTPMDQALGYSTFARAGVTADPVYITRITDPEGRLIARAGEPVEVDGHVIATLPGGPGEQVIPGGVAYEMADMLRANVNEGTGRRAFRDGLWRGGKTGTTNDFIDAWFCGFTPRYTTTVWVGTDGTRTLGGSETGTRAALPAWIEIVDHLPAEQGEMLPVPPEAVLVPYEHEWIGLSRGNVPAGLLAAHVAGDAPLPDFGAGRSYGRRVLPGVASDPVSSGAGTTTGATTAGTTTSGGGVQPIAPTSSPPPGRRPGATPMSRPAPYPVQEDWQQRYPGLSEPPPAVPVEYRGTNGGAPPTDFEAGE